ncbi:hypothetical protein CYMTET_32171 [Cymbomonas tetramitiformis]|uniref:Uncharacterized protein n=1 Tax=Cymbomonas tetramitiformis TaxID=36881 RepID=A0AAE0KS65_9CHLO|nr:hypothetical protein CYMTET_32171 [Cymbomonas tetramitiformis]
MQIYEAIRATKKKGMFMTGVVEHLWRTKTVANNITPEPEKEVQGAYSCFWKEKYFRSYMYHKKVRHFVSPVVLIP